MSWEKPDRIAPNVTIDGFGWKVMQHSDEIKKGQVGGGPNQMNANEIEIDWLLPAENYNFSVKAKSSEQVRQ